MSRQSCFYLFIIQLHGLHRDRISTIRRLIDYMYLELILTSSEIIDRLLIRLGLENDNQLAIFLGVERQQILQYRKGRGSNLNCRIITAILDE